MQWGYLIKLFPFDKVHIFAICTEIRTATSQSSEDLEIKIDKWKKINDRSTQKSWNLSLHFQICTFKLFL